MHDELGHVHLSESRGEQVLLSLATTSLGSLTKYGTGETQYGKNVSETEIIMTLLGELLLAKSVKDGEFLVELVKITVTDRGKLDLDN